MTTTRMRAATGTRGAVVAALATWAVSRAIALVVAATSLGRGTLFNDPNLLWAWANGVPFGGDEAPDLGEYPGAARLLALSGRLVGTPTAFGWWWVAAMLLVDLTVLLVLWRERPGAGWFWVLGGAALGPVVWLRFDLLVALLALLAVRERERRPGWAGVALALAALLKLWPVVLVPALLLRGDWRRWLVAASATLAGGVLVEAALVGPSSLLGPLTYQVRRGLQIESLWATPTLLVERGSDPATVWEFAYRAYQLQGPAPSVLDGGLSVPTAVAVAVMAVAGLGVLVAVRTAGPGSTGTTGPAVSTTGASAGTAGASALGAVRATGAALLVVLVVATNSVFSPQYVMWFLPLVGLVVARSVRLPTATVVVGLAVAALTQVIWPWGYPALLRLQGDVLAVLAVRNLLVLVLAVLLAWRLAGGSGQRVGSGQPGRNDSRT